MSKDAKNNFKYNDGSRGGYEMSALPKRDYITLEEYYALDSASDRRWEYWDGDIVCMSGGSREHGILTGNIHGLLFNIFVPKGCRSFTEGQAIKVDVTESSYVYPDASTACTPTFERHKDRGIDLLLNPVLIVEVTSAESGIRDHNYKRDAYLKISTLRDYLIISSDSFYIVHWTLIDNQWKKRVYDLLNETIELSSLKDSLNMKDIYQGVSTRRN